MTRRRSIVADGNYRWVILGIVYLTFLAYAIAFQSIPPILSLIVEDLHLSHAEAGLLMGLFALPGIFLPIPVGLLADRYGAKNLMILCLVSIIVGSVIMAAGRSFPVLAMGRVIAGIGGVSIFVVGAQFVSRWFVGHELGTAVGIYSTALPVGTIISLNTLGAIGEVAGWQASVLITAVLAVISLIVFVALYKAAPIAASHGTAHQQESALSVILKLGLPIWVLCTIWMLFNAAVISFVTFAPDYFLSEGFGIGVAGFLASFLMLLSLPLAPLIGYMLDRVGREELFMGIGALLVAYSIFAIAMTDSSLILHLILLSVGNALVPTAVFSLPPKIVRPQYVGTGYGIASTGVNLGIVVGPYISGLIRDATGSYQFSFYFMASMSLLMVVFVVLLAVLRQRIR